MLKKIAVFLSIIGSTFLAYNALAHWWVPRPEIVEIRAGLSRDIQAVQRQAALDAAYSQLYYLERSKTDILIALDRSPGSTYLRQRLDDVERQIIDVKDRIRRLGGVL